MNLGVSPVNGDVLLTVEMVAEWNVSTVTVRRLFKDEPGVMVIESRRSRYRRRYRMLRIPPYVRDRVRAKMTNP